MAVLIFIETGRITKPVLVKQVANTGWVNNIYMYSTRIALDIAMYTLGGKLFGQYE